MASKKRANNTGAQLTKVLVFGGKPRVIPGLKTINSWAKNGKARATDGCWVTKGGHCPHQHRSWLVELGYA